MEALYENPFQQHKESLEDTYQDAQENLQQVQGLSTIENDGRQGFISELLTAEDNMQGNQVPISDCDKVKLAILDLDLDRDDQEYLVLNPMKERFFVEIILNEEHKVIDPIVLISLEQSLHEEVIQSFYEKKYEIFVQVSEKYFLDSLVVNDRSVSFEFQELSEVFPRMTDECDKKHDNLVAMSYEDDQKCIQIAEDQGIEDCHLDFSSHISYFEMLFQ